MKTLEDLLAFFGFLLSIIFEFANRKAGYDATESLYANLPIIRSIRKHLAYVAHEREDIDINALVKIMDQTKEDLEIPQNIKDRAFLFADLRNCSFVCGVTFLSAYIVCSLFFL